MIQCDIWVIFGVPIKLDGRVPIKLDGHSETMLVELMGVIGNDLLD